MPLNRNERQVSRLMENERNSIMNFNTSPLEAQLLETAAGQAVYDALVQANIDLRTVSLDVVKQMLLVECRYRSENSARYHACNC